MPRHFVKLMDRGMCVSTDLQTAAAALERAAANPKIEVRRWEIERLGRVVRMQDAAAAEDTSSPRYSITFADERAAAEAHDHVVRGRVREFFIDAGDGPSAAPWLEDAELGAADLAIAYEVLASTTGPSSAALSAAEYRRLVGSTPPQQLVWSSGRIVEARLESSASVRVNEQLLDLLQSPLAASLTVLRVEDCGWPDDSLDDAVQMFLEVLATRTSVPPLRELHLEGHDLGDLTAALERLPGLESLDLHAWYWSVGRVELPRLVRLDARNVSRDYTDLCELSLPSIRSLRLQHLLGDPCGNFTWQGDEMVRRLGRAAWFDGLEELGIHTIYITPELVQSFDSILPKSLRTLDLTRNFCDDEGASALARDAPLCLAHLEVLRLPDVPEVTSRIERLRARLPATRVELGAGPI